MEITFDDNGVRYTRVRVAEEKGAKSYIFLPGGPGADSRYFLELINQLHLPGNVWLVDLPNSGSNIQSASYDFDRWFEIYPSILKRFDRPVLIGHSFGGMLSLLYPENEELLSGLILLNGASVLWREEAIRLAHEYALPDPEEKRKVFLDNPNDDTFKQVVIGFARYYFAPHAVEIGEKWLSNLIFPCAPALWWRTKAVEMNFNAQWIPQKVPTLIVGGDYDCIVPFNLFQQDARFDRPNIQKVLVHDSGHASWVDQPKIVSQLVQKFLDQL